MTNQEAIEVIEYINQIKFGNQSQALNVAIKALSADVRPNIHGHWKVGFGNTWCSCSECSGNGSTNWSYCPWCGADMRE